MVCSNDECVMSYVQPKEPIDWKRLWYKTIYWRPRDGYYYIRNRFFKRYDLVRTGNPKHQWCDVYNKIEDCLKVMLVDFVEKERCFEVVDMDWHNMPGDSSKTIGDEIRALYRMIKVDLPKLEVAEADALTLWANDQHCNIDKDTRKVSISYDAPDDIKETRWNNLQRLEKEVIDMNTNILIRIVKIREHLWT